MPDPFPNELVEAAAKALRTSEIPITLSPTEGWVFDADESARAVLAAVVPLVEQRVIDRLAREAGENPYSRRGAWSPISFVAWRDGAACGVAAERARWEAKLDTIDSYAFGQATCARFTYAEDQPYEAVGDRDSLRLRAFLHAYLAALSPEQTTGEGEAASAQPALPESQ